MLNHIMNISKMYPKNHIETLTGIRAKISLYSIVVMYTKYESYFKEI